MKKPTTPSEIARETFKTLATQKIVPTPENYARIYQKISGQPVVTRMPDAVQKSILPWPELISDLLKQLEVPHKSITITHKKGGLKTALIKFADEPDALYDKLRELLRSWADVPTAPSPGELIRAAPKLTAAIVTTTDSELTVQLRELLAQTLERLLGAHLNLAGEIQALAQQARITADHGQATNLATQLRHFWITLELRDGEKAKIQQETEEHIKHLERQLERAIKMMHADHLTGALNRHGLDEALEREIKRADRNQTPVSIALLHIDNFKQLNDTQIHLAGDMALMHLTKVIKDALRPTDAVARYSDEEFLILLPDTGQEGAMVTITRLQRELTKQFFLADNQRLLITFSAGVALRADGEVAESIIGRAGKAMDYAKQTGKNRVVVA